MWSRKRLDIGWIDLLFGAFRVCFPLNRETAARQVEAIWPSSDNALACLSVRSGFDLLLGVLGLPRGSEVLVSASSLPGYDGSLQRPCRLCSNAACETTVSIARSNMLQREKH
jgi:hypothetical protein